MSEYNVHQCVHLVYFLLNHTGCLGLKVRNKTSAYYIKRYKVYGYLYRFLYLTGLIGGFIYKLVDDELREAMMGTLTPVVKLVLTFECFLSPMSYIKCSLYLDLYRDKYLKVIDTIRSLDEGMTSHFPGIQWNYEKSTRKYNFVSVVLLSYYTTVSSIYIFSIAHCSCGFINSGIISICYAGVTGAPAFAGFLFICQIDLLRLRFRLIMELLRQHCRQTNAEYRVMNSNDVKKFKILENFFMEYSRLIVPVNEIFVVISGFGLFHDFAVITTLGYLLCSKALSTNAKIQEYVFIGLFMIPRIYKVVTTARYGHAAQKERKNCCHEFIKMEYNFVKSTLIYQHMDSFMHWIMHNNYRVTVGKTFNCNLGLIFVILNSAVNYILILIQLQFQQNSIAEQVLQNAEQVFQNVNIGHKDAEILH